MLQIVELALIKRLFMGPPRIFEDWSERWFLEREWNGSILPYYTIPLGSFCIFTIVFLFLYFRIPFRKHAPVNDSQKEYSEETHSGLAAYLKSDIYTIRPSGGGVE